MVRGWPAERGIVDYALVKEPDGPSQEAVTHFVRLQTVEIDEAVPPHQSARYAWLSLRPRTGRTHQLRRHMAHLRHPIIGDVRHGDGRHNRVFRRRFDSHRLLLWATELRFEHPFTGQRVELHASPSLAGPLAALGFRPPARSDDGGATTT